MGCYARHCAFCCRVHKPQGLSYVIKKFMPTYLTARFSMESMIPSSCRMYLRSKPSLAKSMLRSSKSATPTAVPNPILPMFYCGLRCIAFWMGVGLRTSGLARLKLAQQYDILLAVSDRPEQHFIVFQTSPRASLRMFLVRFSCWPRKMVSLIARKHP